MIASRERADRCGNLATESLNIVVVEDHADTRKYLRMYLEMAGHRVRAVGSVRDAVRLLNTDGCEVLISDIGLPDGSGWELLGQIANDPPDFAIAMSGFGGGSDRRRSLEAGFREHFVKPFDLTKLDGLLREAVSERG